MLFIGIDPGEKGGVAVISDGGDPQLYKLPDTERDTIDFFKRFYKLNCFILLEKAQASPVMASRAAFTYGTGFGILRCCLAAYKFSWDYVRPDDWQKTLGCRSKGKKKVTKAAAQRMFPNVPKITHYTADALLIARYAQILWNQRNPQKN